MSAKKSTTIYRTLLRETWNVTRKRKTLWIFGIFAGLISTGGVVDILFSGLQKITVTGSVLAQFDTFSPAFDFFLRMGSSQFQILPVLIILIFLALILFGILSQAILISSTTQSHKTIHEIRARAWKYVWDFFVIDALTKILTIILILLSILPVLFFFVRGDFLSLVVLFVHFLVFIPSVVILHIISMLALVDIVEADHKALDAIHQALRLFKKQWLSTLEFGFLLFILLFLAGVALLIALLFLAIPYSLFFASLVFAGSAIVFIAANIFFLLCVIGLFLLFGGATVTFQYLAWQIFYSHATHRVHGKKVFSKLLRLVTQKM